MSLLVNTRLRFSGRQQAFESDSPEIRRGVAVIVDTDAGAEIATVLEVQDRDGQDGEKLRRVIRVATDEDLEVIEANRRLEDEGRRYCMERIAFRKLPMRLVGTEITFDKKKFTFFFTAEKRVDFRELVKDLASKFRTRIELRQIGIRDEAKLLGGLGNCGREVCCKLFLNEFAPISIKMAKKQDIALNPSKISGRCGRLMCCLSYEYRQKEERKKGEAPSDRRKERPRRVDKESPPEKVVRTEVPVPETAPDRPTEPAPVPPDRQAETPTAPKRRRRRRRKSRDGRSTPPAASTPDRSAAQELQAPAKPEKKQPGASAGEDSKPGAETEGEKPRRRRRRRRNRKKKSPNEESTS